MVPLLIAVGRQWADGALDVRHEHFCTEVVEDVLRTIRRGLPEAEYGERLLLTTLPGERHALGLYMAAIVCRANGFCVRILGTDTPLDQIAQAADRIDPRLPSDHEDPRVAGRLVDPAQVVEVKLEARAAQQLGVNQTRIEGPDGEPVGRRDRQPVGADKVSGPGNVDDPYAGAVDILSVVI